MMMSSNYNKPRRALAEKSNDTASNNTNSSKAAAAANPLAKAQQEKKQQLMDEFVKERVQQLEQELEIIKQEQRQLIGNTILKMPKSARNMTLGEYKKKYGVNLREELPIPTAPTSAAAAAAAFPMTPATGLRNISKFTKATPMTMRTRPMATPATVRALRRGEAVFSQRGSPLNALEEGCLVATVEAPRHRRPGAMAGAKHTAAGHPTKNGPHFPSSPEIDFHLGAGQCLSLKDSDSLQHLDPSAKEAAAAQIRVMKEQMDRILSRLEQE